MRHTRIAALVAATCLLGAACTASNDESVTGDTVVRVPPDAVKITPAMDPAPPVLHSDDWQQPVPIEAPVGTAGGEDSPFVTPDGDTLYFFYTPDLDVPPQQQVVDGITGIWVSHRTDESWSEPERVVLSDAGDPSLDGCGFVLDDVMWFCTVRAGNSREIDIWTARLVDGRWTGWTNAGEPLNVEYMVGEMHISSDGAEMYFHTGRPGGVGDLDIWVTRLVDGAWQPPVNVAEVNSPGPDGWPYLSEDGTELWITRVYEGSPALFRATRDAVDAPWGAPELVVSSFAGEASLDREGNLYFTHHLLSPDGDIVEADIYVSRPTGG